MKASRASWNLRAPRLEDDSRVDASTFPISSYCNAASGGSSICQSYIRKHSYIHLKTRLPEAGLDIVAIATRVLYWSLGSTSQTFDLLVSVQGNHRLPAISGAFARQLLPRGEPHAQRE